MSRQNACRVFLDLFVDGVAHHVAVQQFVVVLGNLLTHLQQITISATAHAAATKLHRIRCCIIIAWILHVLRLLSSIGVGAEAALLHR